MRKRPACHWTFVATLLAGSWLHNRPEPSICGKVAARARRCSHTFPPRTASVSGCRSRTNRVRGGFRKRGGRLPDRTPDDEARRLTAYISRARSTSELLTRSDGALENAALFNHVHMSAALTRLSKFKRARQFYRSDASSPVWAKLCDRLDSMLREDSLPPRQVANVFYSVHELYEEMDRHQTRLLPKLCDAVRAKAAGMKAQELSNCLLAAAKLQDTSRAVLVVVPALANCIPDKVADMIPQHLSNCLWAAATLHDASPEVLEAVPALVKSIPDKVEEMIPQHLSNCLWGAATLQEALPEVVTAVPALAQHTPEQAQDMKPQELSNSLWAAAKLQDATPEVLLAVPALADIIPDKAQHMKPQELSNTLLAVAKLQYASPKMLVAMTALVEHIPGHAQRMNAQELSNCLWAAARLHDASPDVLFAMPALAQHLLDETQDMMRHRLCRLLPAPSQSS
ncbi:unnamed protein product [Symbiodinium sp. CCMP2592]|nr:unnamed protein product [Symbiodinium sp. CCMP2592]